MIQLQIKNYTYEEKFLLAQSLATGFNTLRNDLCEKELCDMCKNKKVCKDLFSAINYIANSTTDNH